MTLVNSSCHRFISQDIASRVLDSKKLTKQQKFLFSCVYRKQQEVNRLFDNFICLTRAQIVGIEVEYNENAVHQFAKAHKELYISYQRYLWFYFIHEEEINIIIKSVCPE